MNFLHKKFNNYKYFIIKKLIKIYKLDIIFEYYVIMNDILQV